MKKFIGSILLFAPFSIVMYIVFIILWGNYAPVLLQKNLNDTIGSSGHMYSRLRNIQEAKDVDILILGSSHAYRGFDPRIFKRYGLNVFNLGSSSQTPIQTELLLNRYLDTIHPRLIIYEVYPEIFSIDGVESALDIISNDKNDLGSVKMALTENHIKVYNALIYGFYRDITRRNVNFKEDTMKGDDTYIQGGFVEKRIRYFEPVESTESYYWNLTSPQYEHFEKVLLLIKERNIPVIFVQAPITQSMYRSFLNNKEYDDKMRTYGVYHNFNELMKLDDRLDFYNSNHLNQNGVEKFNTKLIEILQEQEAWLFK